MLGDWGGGRMELWGGSSCLDGWMFSLCGWWGAVERGSEWTVDCHAIFSRGIHSFIDSHTPQGYPGYTCDV